ncbi:MAG: hypothetical protein K1X61_00870 [Chitinophagales bacterium]|nr:hypothetical protein [Chitinophagales bacterium]
MKITSLHLPNAGWLFFPVNKMRQIHWIICFFLLLPSTDFAQSTASVLSDRICKNWKMIRLEEVKKSLATDQAAGEFVMVLHPDHTMVQGMYPDGLIPSTWEIDEQQRMLSIKDKQTGLVYQMKIIKLTAAELVLQDQSAASGLTIYYSTK